MGGAEGMVFFRGSKPLTPLATRISLVAGNRETGGIKLPYTAPLPFIIPPVHTRPLVQLVRASSSGQTTGPEISLVLRSRDGEFQLVFPLEFVETSEIAIFWD